jgi:hypothetical protein
MFRKISKMRVMLRDGVDGGEVLYTGGHDVAQVEANEVPIPDGGFVLHTCDVHEDEEGEGNNAEERYLRIVTVYLLRGRSRTGVWFCDDPETKRATHDYRITIVTIIEKATHIYTNGWDNHRRDRSGFAYTSDVD